MKPTDYGFVKAGARGLRVGSMRRVWPVLAACLALAACGGGGGGGNQPATPDPIGGTPPPTSTPPPSTPNPDPQQPPAPTPDPTPNPPAPTPDPDPAPNPPPEEPARPKSAKRGVAYDLNDPSDLAALAPGVSWWYRWALKPGNGVPTDYRSRYDMDFIPMLWNGNFNATEVETFLRANAHIKFLLLLNEPNLTDQANLTPQQAAQLWPRYEAIAANTGVQLVGPAMTWGTMQGFADPVVWLDAFYASYRAANGGRDPRIDYLAFHWYDYGLAGQLDRLAKYGKPFWVTEFANWHSGNDGAQIDSVAKQKAQMTEMVAVCESRDDVFRYAWFTGRWTDEANRHTSLLGRAGELTELGQHYLAQPYWVGAWTNPGVSQKLTSASLSQQTLRQIVRTTVPGSAARVRLSNASGTQPLTVSDVHIALRTSDASIDPSTDRKVTFGGRASVTLAPGAEVYSDRAFLAVPAQADLAVSFYLANAPMVAGGQTPRAGQLPTYVAMGDVSGDADIAVSHQIDGYPLLAGVDVQGEALRGSIAMLGDSIAAGVGVDAGGQSWPDMLAERLSEANIYVGVLKQSQSVRANSLARSAKVRNAVDVLQQSNVRWAIYSAAFSDDLRRAQPSYEQLLASLQDVTSQTQSRQVKLLCGTVTPYEGDPTWNPAAEQVRQRYNDLIRSADSGCDAVIDQDRAVRDPSQPTRLLPMYDSGDHIHPNAAGHRAIANEVDLNVFLMP